ncbi:MAG: cobalamin-binding protein [Gammaproteobacteria bacterium]|nr:cobalamin-binding protein [Gammaproteobacteria bacterium]
MRIVSLLPSATEIVCSLGLEADLVGITHECDYPPSVHGLPAVTTTAIPHDAASRDIDAAVRERLAGTRALYSLDVARLAALAPDLIVTQALCDVCAVADVEVRAAAAALARVPRVVNLEPFTLDEVFDCISAVGAAAGVGERAATVVAGLRARVAAVVARNQALAARPRVALLEWLDPPFGCGHWSPELVAMAGGEEVLGRAGQASTTSSWAELAAADPDVLVFACCGFDPARTRVDIELVMREPAVRALRAVRDGRLWLVDGNQYFSRPGPRLVDSLEILAHALHPALHPLPAGLPAAEAIAAPPVTPTAHA